jgi:hypothetical protein
MSNHGILSSKMKNKAASPPLAIVCQDIKNRILYFFLKITTWHWYMQPQPISGRIKPGSRTGFGALQEHIIARAIFPGSAMGAIHLGINIHS